MGGLSPNASLLSLDEIKLLPIGTNGGYVLRYLSKGHPQVAGPTVCWQFEHRLVLEAVLGRRLLKTEKTHHLDENKQNNDPQNLVIMEIGAHAFLHSPPGGDYVNCLHCGSRFYRSPLDRRRGRRYCSKPCGAHSPKAEESARRNLVGKPADSQLNAWVFKQKQSGETWKGIADSLGCSIGTTRDRYYQHTHGIARRAHSSQKERVNGRRST